MDMRSQYSHESVAIASSLNQFEASGRRVPLSSADLVDVRVNHYMLDACPVALHNPSVDQFD
jgi:hypothetical protein